MASLLPPPLTPKRVEVDRCRLAFDTFPSIPQEESFMRLCLYPEGVRVCPREESFNPDFTRLSFAKFHRDRPHPLLAVIRGRFTFKLMWAEKMFF
ncbi:hypothetical protein TNCV_4532261 [Trichonephila clavipes]|nr:hypothetical protein TNCV_4532261 [Trichonephila clavipes]